jgi:hypothetical protein
MLNDPRLDIKSFALASSHRTESTDNTARLRADRPNH